MGESANPVNFANYFRTVSVKGGGNVYEYFRPIGHIYSMVYCPKVEVPMPREDFAKLANAALSRRNNYKSSW